MTRKNPEQIKSMKGGDTPIVCLTAYGYSTAKAVDPHCDLVLVGDSLGTVLYGMDNTTGVTMDMMINHGRAVAKGVENACLVVDMPYGSYEEGPEVALKNARRLVEETGCDAVKMEGGVAMADQIAHLVQNGIPVMGHIGLLPQSVVKEGGYKIKGKTDAQIQALHQDGQAVADAGAFSYVLEGTLEHVSADLTKAISIPSIGIGASVECDGQILVTDDMTGFTAGHIPKFAKQYAHILDQVEQAAESYAKDVRARAFPGRDHVYVKKAAQ